MSIELTLLQFSLIVLRQSCPMQCTYNLPFCGLGKTSGIKFEEQSTLQKTCDFTLRNSIFESSRNFLLSSSLFDMTPGFDHMT